MIRNLEIIGEAAKNLPDEVIARASEVGCAAHLLSEPTMDKPGAVELVDFLGSQADAHGIESLSEHQRNVLVPYWARGVLSNGGFKYLCEGSYPLSEVAVRFRALGLAEAADACQEADRRIRLAAAEAGREGAAAPPPSFDWDSVDDQLLIVYRLSYEQLEEAIARYVWAHPETAAVEGWQPSPRADGPLRIKP